VTTCEDELIQSAAHGDQEAFRQFWEAHHAVAMTAALCLCHHRSLAEDITHGSLRVRPFTDAGEAKYLVLSLNYLRLYLPMADGQRQH
jgi:hypothetical protein